MATDNIIAFGTHHNHNSPMATNNKKIVATCREILKKNLPNCFNFFTHLDDSLFKHAEQSKNNQRQEEYFIAMRRFRVEQENIKTQFTKLILTDFDNFWKTSITQANVKSEDNEEAELTLLQNDLLEEKIALENIVSKAEKICGKEILQLEKRLANILGSDTITYSPLDFKMIAEHLKTVITPAVQDLDITIKLLVYKQFEHYAVTELEIIIQLLNDELIKQGVLPELVNTKRKNVRHPAHSPNIHEPDDNYDEEDPALFDELRRLLSKSGAAHPSSPAPQSDVVALNTLVSVLSNLQQKTDFQPNVDVNGEIIIPDIRQSLHASLGHGKTVRQIDEDTINVISLLFEFILEDQAIPAPIRALLARLQLPMLKVAITDKSFFSKKNHTARRLLNNLAKISTGWDHTNGTEDILYNQIESVVNTVLTRFDSDMTVFDELNEQLNQFMAQQEQSRVLAEQRIAKATEGQEKLQIAEQEVDRVINELMAKYSPVPKAVIALVDEGWKKVLRLRYLQKGKESQEWQEAVMLLDQLLWSVSPKLTPQERKELIDSIPGLLRALRNNLSGASFNQHKITSLFNDLKECHIKCLNGDTLDQQQLQSIEEKGTNSEPEQNILAKVPTEKKVISDEEAMNIAKSLQVGTWLEKKSDDGQMQRIKFSWRSNLTGRCLFVTYQGMKAADVTLPELASWFQQGLVKVLDEVDKPLIDRALVSLKESMDQQDDS